MRVNRDSFRVIREETTCGIARAARYARAVVNPVSGRQGLIVRVPQTLPGCRHRIPGIAPGRPLRAPNWTTIFTISMLGAEKSLSSARCGGLRFTYGVGWWLGMTLEGWRFSSVCFDIRCASRIFCARWPRWTQRKNIRDWRDSIAEWRMASSKNWPRMPGHYPTPREKRCKLNYPAEVPVPICRFWPRPPK